MQTQLKVKMNKMNPTLDRNVVGLNDGDMDGLVDGDMDGSRLGLAEWISLGDSVSVIDGVRLGVWLTLKDGLWLIDGQLS